MNSKLGSTLIAVVLTVLTLSSCDETEADGSSFAISLIESGEAILTDEHIESYEWDGHRIVLTPKGVVRWEAFTKFDQTQSPPVPMLRDSSQREFAVTVDGVEMYRGHFWSMLSSLMGSGVKIYDHRGAASNEVILSFTSLDGDARVDPRGHPEIEAHLRKQGKLKQGR